MMRNCIAGVLSLVALGSLKADENPLVQRGRIDGREFSELGQLYVDDDKLIHFRTDQRLYFFSHMYYIWDTLAESGAVTDGKITYDKPLRITGNYSKAEYVYNFLQEPALRGSQIVWVDQIEKVELPAGQQNTLMPLFDGESLGGWTITPAPAADRTTWVVKDKVISGSAPSAGGAEKLISGAAFTDFELSFEYRSSWGNSASLLLRANEKGEGIALSLDHTDEGTIGLPKSAAGASRPFMLYETREKRGVGASSHVHIQYDGRFNYDAVARDKLLECSRLREFLKQWDGAFWNLVRVRCVGADPEITVWINGFLVSKFNAKTVVMREKNPAHIGAIENFVVHPSGHIGFAIHSAQLEEPEFLLREVRVVNLAEADPEQSDNGTTRSDEALLFLIAGQSNAGGVAAFSPETNQKSGMAEKHPTIPGSTAEEVGIPTNMEAYPRSYIWGRDGFERLTPGKNLNGGYRDPWRHGIELPMAMLLEKKNPEADKFIIKHGPGGHNLHTQWKAGSGPDYQAFMAQYNGAIADLKRRYADVRIIGLYWDQGESDRPKAQEYAMNLRALFAAFREDTGISGLPIFVRKHLFQHGDESFVPILDAQVEVSAADPQAHLLDLDLGSNEENFKAWAWTDKNGHLSSKAYLELAGRIQKEIDMIQRASASSGSVGNSPRNVKE